MHLFDLRLQAQTRIKSTHRSNKEGTKHCADQHPYPQVRGSSRVTTAYLNRIATAVPDHDVHSAFVVFAEKMLADPRLRTLFRRMVSRAEIAHRYSFLD